MNLVLLGPPGAGKGTQAKLLEEELGLKRIATGDLLRSAAANKTALGKEAGAYMQQGKLVPDSIMLGMIRELLQNEKLPRGFLLDGFPRTIEQAKALEELLKEKRTPLTAAVSLQVPLDDLIKRLTFRRTCPECGSVYHIKNRLPKEDSLCDNCKTLLIQRDDDKEEVVKERFRVYEEQTKPLVGYYRGKGLLMEMDGSSPIPEVAKKLLSMVQKREKENVHDSA